MTLQQIIYTIKIAECGSMNKASEKLFISQPSLTSSIKELEKEIGIEIFERTNRGMIPTSDGKSFLVYARQMYQQYELMTQRFLSQQKNIIQKFSVSTQHYSFAVKAFVDTIKQFDISRYEFSIREEKTAEVIEDVANLKSNIGIIYINGFNKKVIGKLLKSYDIEFHKLVSCKAYVYLWKNHPLAKKESISFDELEPYPCLSFEQGDNESFFFSEEILSTNEYNRIIKATDRATMLNLMVGLNGYTLCSGIICEELNTDNYIAVPFEADEENPNSNMDIGYILKKNSVLGDICEKYIEEITKYLA